MNIAERKRRENISEYIIEMYKTEDLIRAYEFDIDKIDKYMISHLPGDAHEKQRIKEWYASLAESMESQNLIKTGHLSETQKIVSELEELHLELSGNDKEYAIILQSAQDHFDSFATLAGETGFSDIQVCLNAIYGLLLLRLNNRPVHDKQLESIDKFGAILSYLSYKYRMTSK